MPQPCIEVAGLVKSYLRHEGGLLARWLGRGSRRVRALDGVDLRVAAGEMLALIGPNGAGKSTLVKVLCGILVPDAGTCRVDGRVPWTERRSHVARIGVVFGQRSQLAWDLPVQDSFALLRRIYRIAPADFTAACDELVELLALAPLLARPVRQLSLGERMRCELAAALLHDPALLVLDEPTIGLDAPAKLAVRAFLARRNRDRGTTVLLTTHDLDDVEALCRRVVVVGAGRVLVDGPVERLRALGGTMRRLDAVLDGAPPALDAPGLSVLDAAPGRLRCTVDTARMPIAEAIGRIAAGARIIDLTVTPPHIDAVVAALYQDAVAVDGLRREAGPVFFQPWPASATGGTFTR